MGPGWYWLARKFGPGVGPPGNPLGEVVDPEVEVGRCGVVWACA